MCPHLHVDTQGLVTRDTTCTEAGFVPAETCRDCGQVIAKATDIAPLGHEWGPDGACVRCGLLESAIHPDGGSDSEGTVPGTDSDSDATTGTDGNIGSGSTSGGSETGSDTTTSVKSEAIYRLYNRISGEHLFTRDVNEVKVLCEGPDWTYEKVAWQSPSLSDVAVHRLLNPNTGEHIYTKDPNERDTLVAIGWRYEDVAWYSADADGTRVYRLFNPYVDGPGAHHYTTDPVEYRELAKLGWRQENVCWYGLTTD